MLRAPADITVHQQRAVPSFREGQGEVGGQKRLAVARTRTRECQCQRATLPQKVQDVHPDAAQGFDSRPQVVGTEGIPYGAGNVVVVLLFAVSWFLRRDNPADPGVLAVALSAIGAALAGATGWLGGELVDRLGVGVDDGANLDAPSSLTHDTTARETISR